LTPSLVLGAKKSAARILIEKLSSAFSDRDSVFAFDDSSAKLRFPLSGGLGGMSAFDPLRT
jgi:hypothetical protein